MESNPESHELAGKLSENTQKILNHAVVIASRMGHDMVGTQHVLWGLFEIEDNSKPYIRNWLEHNIGVTKDMIFENFKKFIPDFKYDEASTHEVQWQSERLIKAIKIAGKV